MGPFLSQEWKTWDSTSIERVHTQFLKRILGVNRSTTNILVRCELGRHSLIEQITTRNINYINYIEKKNQTALVSQAAGYELINGQNRTNLYSIFNTYEQRISNHNIRISSKHKLRTLIREEFDNTWQTYSTSFSKAETFKTFKNSVKFEPYLNDIKKQKIQSSI